MIAQQLRGALVCSVCMTGGTILLIRFPVLTHMIVSILVTAHWLIGARVRSVHWTGGRMDKIRFWVLAYR